MKQYIPIASEEELNGKQNSQLFTKEYEKESGLYLAHIQESCVASQRGPGLALNPRLPGNKSCALTSWPKRYPLDQVARAYDQLDA